MQLAMANDSYRELIESESAVIIKQEQKIDQIVQNTPKIIDTNTLNTPADLQTMTSKDTPTAEEMKKLFKKQGQSEIFVDRQKLAEQKEQKRMDEARQEENERKKAEMKKQLSAYIAKI